MRGEELTVVNSDQCISSDDLDDGSASGGIHQQSYIQKQSLGGSTGWGISFSCVIVCL